jgi:hypothetical protein
MSSDATGLRFVIVPSAIVCNVETLNCCIIAISTATSLYGDNDMSLPNVHK